MLDRFLSYWPLGLLFGGLTVGLIVLFRSLRRWRTPPPTSAEAKQAESRLWATKGMDQR